MWCAREIYERMSAHLLNQGAVSRDENGSCRLRGANGRKCAVGSLIGDEFCRPDTKGTGISYYRHARDGKLLRALYASNLDVYDPCIVDLLCELEQVHDDASVDQSSGLIFSPLSASATRSSDKRNK